MKKLSAPIALLAFFSSPVSAGVLNSSPSQTPFLYRYASCVFAPHPDGPEAAIRECQELKKVLTAQGQEAIYLFERSAALQRKRQLTLAFRRLETEAVEAVQQHKTVPEPIVDYLGCIGKEIIKDQYFKAGISIEYMAFEPMCKTEVFDEAVSRLPESQRRRANDLYHRFRHTGRIIFAPDGFGSSIWRDGLLGLRYLPDDKQTPES